MSSYAILQPPYILRTIATLQSLRQRVEAMPGRGRYSNISRFPPNRVKKIMQEDEEVRGVVALLYHWWWCSQS